MRMTFRMWLTLRSIILGWTIAVTGGSALHFTTSELTISLSIIGSLVPLGVAYLTTRNRGRDSDLLESAKIRKLQDENMKLRKLLREKERE